MPLTFQSIARFELGVKDFSALNVVCNQKIGFINGWAPLKAFLSTKKGRRMLAHSNRPDAEISKDFSLNKSWCRRRDSNIIPANFCEPLIHMTLPLKSAIYTKILILQYIHWIQFIQPVLKKSTRILPDLKSNNLTGRGWIGDTMEDLERESYHLSSVLCNLSKTLERSYN